MFQRKPVPVEKLKASFPILETAVQPDHGLKKKHITLSKTIVQSSVSNVFDDHTACKMYYSLRHIFIIDAQQEMKKLSDEGNLRVTLMRTKKPTEAELNYRNHLHRLLHNPNFKTSDIIRFYRQAERALQPEPVVEVEGFDPHDFTGLFQNLQVKHSINTADEKALAWPEDSIFLEFTPQILVLRARDIGIIGPELITLDALAKQIVSRSY